MKSTFIVLLAIIIGLLIAPRESYAHAEPQCPNPGKPVNGSPDGDDCQDETGIRLTWAQKNCHGYKVYLGSTGESGPFDYLGLVTPQTHNWFDVGDAYLEPYTQYWWYVKAGYWAGCGPDKWVNSDVWTFTTGPGQASGEDPFNGATEVALDALLMWTPGAGIAASNGHEVYFGTNSSNVNNADTTDTTGIYQGAQDSNSFDPNLSSDSQYYWRVDEVNSPCRCKGDVWQFSTACVDPNKATDPYPAHNATDIAFDVVLTWIEGDWTDSFYVYLGTDFNDVNDADTTDTTGIYRGNQDSNSYDDPNLFSPSTDYFWRIDANSDCNLTTGSVWKFTAADPTVKKGPYLIYDGNNTEMTVLWQLDCNVTCTLQWGPNTTYPNDVNTTEYTTDHLHKYTITSLTPGSKYYYRLQVPPDACHPGTFWTAPDVNATDVKFLAYGDTRADDGNIPYDHNNVCSAMLEDSNYLTFTLHTGDWVYDGNSESDWDTMYFNRSLYKAVEMQANLPVQGSTGNHEVSDGNAVAYEKYWPYFYEPNGRYWSFDYGPAHVAVLDQYAEGTYPTDNNTGAEQLAWLEADLNSTSAPWKFIVLHEPGYSAGGTGHSDNNDVKEDIQPLCEQYGVDIVFAGHNHYYARCEVNDVTHITTGGGGAPLREPNKNYSGYVQECNSVYHFCKIAISDCQLDFEVVDVNNTVIDSFTIVHDPNKAANPDVSGPTGEPNAIDSTLSWTPGEWATSQDIYFGTDADNLKFMCNVSVDVNHFDTRRMYGFLSADNTITNIGPLNWTYGPDGNIIYVDLDANGAGDGTSWEDAFTDINSAMSAAGSGDEIWVSEGTYYPTDTNDRSISIQLEPNVALYGGFAGTEEGRVQRDWKTHETILSGDINIPDDVNDNSYHVVKGADNAVLDGFTITLGRADGPTNDDKRGGGMFNFSCSPTVANCLFSYNHATGVTGTYWIAGGGMYNYNCSPDISNCVFLENSTATEGGAMSNDSASSSISNCMFIKNYSQQWTGGVDNKNCSPTLINCTFVGNEANQDGGGGLLNWETSNPNIINCIFWGNSAAYPNTAQIFNYDSGSLGYVRHCTVQGGINNIDYYLPIDGGGNIDSDPCFADMNDPEGLDGVFGTADDGLRLTADSNCIDRGDSSAVSIELDATGNVRRADDPNSGDNNGSGPAPMVDMGAYEFNSHPPHAAKKGAEAFSTNQSGRIVGVAYDPSGNAHAFITVPSGGSEPNWTSPLVDLHPYGDPNESSAYDISDANWIVGSIGDKAFVLKFSVDMNMIKLPSIFSEGDNNSVARAISSGINGQGPVAVGWSGGYAVFWDSLDSNDPNIHILGTLGPYSKSRAYDVSEYGGVAGYYYPMFEDEPNDRAFIGDLDSGLTDIGTLEQGNVSRAYGISDAGQVVGEATVDSNDDQLRAFVYEKGQMYDLNKLVRIDTNEPNWVIASARSISDEGHIVGYGRLSDTNDPNSNYNRALLLVPVPEPVGHWRLDEHSGNMAMDASPSGNHGQLNGPTWTAGKIRGGLSFDGEDDYVACGSSYGSVTGTTSKSIMGWVKSDTTGYSSAGRIISLYRANGSTGFAIYAEGNPATWEGLYRKASDASQQLDSGVSVTADAWTHVALVQDGANVEIYINGTSENSATDGAAPSISNPPLADIGAYDAAAAGMMCFFSGSIDDVRIYPYALNQEEITELFEAGSWD